jgi:hypothetical protein
MDDAVALGIRDPGAKEAGAAAANTCLLHILRLLLLLFPRITPRVCSNMH